MKNSFHETYDSFSLFHANVRSLKCKFEYLHTHLLSELGYSFNITGRTETRITENDQSDYQPSIPGYSFELAPTPLAAQGVGMFIDQRKLYSHRKNLVTRFSSPVG